MAIWLLCVQLSNKHFTSLCLKRGFSLGVKLQYSLDISDAKSSTLKLFQLFKD